MLRPLDRDMNGRHIDRRIIFMLNLCRSTCWLAYGILNSPECLDTTAVEHVAHHSRLEAALNTWARGHHNRVTTTDEEIKTRAGSEFSRGIYIGFWDEDDVLQAKRSNSGEGGN